MKVLLIDGHALFREGLRPILRHLTEGVSKILEAGSFSEGLKLAGQHADMNMVLLEIEAPGSEGANSIKVFRQHYPYTPLVVVSSVEDSHVIKEALNNGADGFVCKSSSRANLLSALTLVLAGSIYVPQQLLHSTGIARDGKQNSCDFHDAGGGKCYLTPRQAEVLGYLMDGLSAKEIALRTQLAVGTVKTHVAALYQALGVRKRMEAVQVAKRLGLAGMTEA